jgi:hypothetical protein
VDRFELNMRQRGFNQRRIGRMFIVEESLQSGHAVFDVGRWSWDEMGIARTGAADPILRAAKFTGEFLAAPARDSNTECISRMSLFDSGKPSRSRAMPCSSEAT